MGLRTANVIKRHKVQIVGAVHLTAGPATAPVRRSTPAPSAAPAAGPMQAKIVESNSEYAIIEIVCSCGQKTHIQCNYANAAKE